MSVPDTKSLREAFGAFMTGVTVVTSHDAQGAPIGFTANSFTSVSLEPPLLLVCLARSSSNFNAFVDAPGFAVNVLSEGQKDVSNVFARPSKDRFGAVDWGKGPHGSPVLGEVAAWFDCAMDKVVEAGDHVILIGRVEAFGNSQANGLGYTRGSYFTPQLAQEAVSAAGMDEGVKAAAVATQNDEVLLFERDGDRLVLPSFDLAPGEGPASFARRLEAATGLAVSVGFVFAVRNQAGARMIVYRCELGGGRCERGHFFAPGTVPLDRIDEETCDIVRRFLAESELAVFGEKASRG